MAQIHQPCIRDPMDLNDFICCSAKVNTQIEALTFTSLLSEEADVGFLVTAHDEGNFTESK